MVAKPGGCNGDAQRVPLPSGAGKNVEDGLTAHILQSCQVQVYSEFINIMLALLGIGVSPVSLG
ncbi:MAG: hypothetical protein DRR42_11190 [Gammaproteobacteria bacterium]|nr:MAG: hypothetical protein DRR42_11190 [Gammaproteobacteria bacterium]